MKTSTKRHVVKGRVTDKQFKKLAAICEQKGITVSEWVRDKIERAKEG